MRTGRFIRIAGPAFDFGDQPGHQRRVLSVARCDTDIVLENEIVRMRLSPMFEPVGQQCGFAASGVAEQHERRAIVCGMAVESLKVRGPA